MNDEARPARIDLNLFRVFVEIFRAESLTQAAARLALTQPAVSNALARLRAELDDELFVREGRRMVPTARARELAPGVLAALSALEAARPTSELRFSPQASERRYTVGMRVGLEPVLLPPVVRALEPEAPKVRVHSVRFERRKLARMLASAALDLAVDVLLPAPDEIRCRPLFAEELCVAARAGHPLLRARRLSVETFLAARQVAVSARPRGPALEDLALERLGLAREVSVRCQHYYTACLLLLQSDLVLMLPRRYAEHFRSHVPIALVAPPFAIPELQVALYWHVRAERDPSLVWLIERITALRDEMGGVVMPRL